MSKAIIKKENILKRIADLLLVVGFFTICAFLSNAWMYVHGGLMFDNYHDSIAQVIPFTYLLQQSFESGEHFWSWSYGLGGDIFSEFTYYYTTSPFFYLQYILAKAIGVVGAPILIFNKFRAIFCIIKQVIIMLAMYSLLRYEKLDKAFSLMSSVLYGCSYLVIFWYIHFDFFTDAFLWLPITVLAYNQYRNTRNWLPLAFSIALTVGNSFYFGYMSCIFFAMYFLLFTLPESDFAFGQYFREMLKLAGISLLGVGISAVGFLPSVMAVFTADRQSIDVKYGFVQESQFIKALPEILFTNYGLFCFPLICSLIVFIDWKNSSKKLKRKTGLTFLWGIFLIFPFWGSVMNGFSYESDRWYFIVVFLVCYSLPDWMLNIKENGRLSISKVLLVSLVALAVFLSRSRRTSPGSSLTYGSLSFLITDIIPVILGLLSVLMVYVWQKNKQKKNRESASKILIIIFVIAANMYYTNSNSMQGLFLSPDNLPDIEIATGNTETRTTNRLLKPKKTEFFRVDNRETQESYLSYLSANQSQYALDYTSAAYNSMINEDLHNCLKRKYNLHNSIVAPSLYLGFDDRLFLETAWGVEYKINNNYNCGQYKRVSLSNGEQVQENQHKVGIDLWYDSCISEKESEGYDYAQLDALILQTAIVEDEERETVALNNPSIKEITRYKEYNLEDAVIEGGAINNGIVNVDDHAVIKFDIPKDFYEGQGEMLASVKITEEDGRQFFYSINGKEALRNADDWKWTYHLNDFSSVIAKDREKLIIELSEGNYSVENIRVSFNPFFPVSDWVAQRNRYNLENLIVDGSHVSGTISNAEKGILALSMPFSRGWTCTIDGNEARTIKVNDIFTGILLEPGDHVIEFRYFPPYLIIGFIVSVVFVAVSIGIFLICRTKNQEKF